MWAPEVAWKLRIQPVTDWAIRSRRGSIDHVTFIAIYISTPVSSCPLHSFSNDVSRRLLYQNSVNFLCIYVVLEPSNNSQKTSESNSFVKNSSRNILAGVATAARPGKSINRGSNTVRDMSFEILRHPKYIDRL